MAVMYCPKCIVEVMDLINHEEGTDFEIFNEGTENEIREEFDYVVFSLPLYTKFYYINF